MAAPLYRKWPSLRLGFPLNLPRYFAHSARTLSSNSVSNEKKPWHSLNTVVPTFVPKRSSSDQERSRSDTVPDTKKTLSASAVAMSSNGRLGHFMQLYEDFVGLTEVKQAQDKVVDAENQFLKVQDDRRTTQQDLVGVQADLRSVGNELEKTHRTDPKYIELVKKEHEILLVEKEMNSKIKDLDKAERDSFSLLSAAVRESHEKERARAERTKYWSVIGSVIGALIGITGSTWNNRMRLKEMRAIVTESNESAIQYKEAASELIKSLSFLQDVLSDDFEFIKDRNDNCRVSPDTVPQNNPELKHIAEKTDHIIDSIREQKDVILSNLSEVKKICCVQNAQSDDITSVVYVGPEIKQMLGETKTEIQKDALKTMIPVSVLGCFLTVGLSVLVSYFRGP